MTVKSNLTSVRRQTPISGMAIFSIAALSLAGSAAAAAILMARPTSSTPQAALVSAPQLAAGVSALALLTTRPDAVDANAVSAPSPVVSQPAASADSNSGKLGMNLAFPSYYSHNSVFLNMALGGAWARSNPSKQIWWATMPASQIGPDGVILYLNPGERALMPLTPPTAIFLGKSVTVRCSFKGDGAIEPLNAGAFTRSGRDVSFVWKGLSANFDRLQAQTGPKIMITKTNPSDPVRNIDCRDANASSTATFDPVFLGNLRPFGTLRFMDWMMINGNRPVTWATRTTRDSNTPTQGNDGIPVEYMVELGNVAGKDLWFAMPYNADDDYIRRFATYVRDNLNPAKKVYVELSNEVWNYGFRQTLQARDEGVAAKLASDRHEAMLLRYAQKSAHVLKIWTEVFAKQPTRLVRVIGMQNGASYTAEKIMAFPGTAANVDAIAVAPYFYGNLTELGAKSMPLDQFMDVPMQQRIDLAIATAAKTQKIAKLYNKRLIAYEAGQHFLDSDLSLLTAVNRHPKMGTAYTKYLNAWTGQFNDLMMLYWDAGRYSKYGSWGLREYTGQPLSEAPKAAAVEAFVK